MHNHEIAFAQRRNDFCCQAAAVANFNRLKPGPSVFCHEHCPILAVAKQRARWDLQHVLTLP